MRRTRILYSGTGLSGTNRGGTRNGCVSDPEAFDINFEAYKQWREENMRIRLRPGMASSKLGTDLYDWHRNVLNGCILTISEANRVSQWDEDNKERLKFFIVEEKQETYKKATSPYRRKYPDIPMDWEKYFEGPLMELPISLYLKLSEALGKHMFGNGINGYIRIVLELFELDEEMSVNNFLKAFHGNKIKKTVDKFLSEYPKTKQLIVKQRFGIGTKNCRTKTLGEIGDSVNLTRERVRQIEKKMLEKLKLHQPFIDLKK